jgi:D-glycero-beta-D-manno-heptose-7-phosphate kinase
MKNFAMQFKKKTVLVIGDVMLDEYIFGKITRMSPEASRAPVVLIKNRRYAMGGAANVAHNIVSLGGTAILLGCIGNDEHGHVLRKLLSEAGIKDCSFISADRSMTVKTRIFHGARQIARVDQETTKSLTRRELSLCSKKLHRLPRHIDFVIISDYAKGMLSKKSLRLILNRFPGERIIADPKPIHKNLFRNLRLITPNLKEVSDMTRTELKRHGDISRVIQSLTKDMKTSVLATLGRHGMMLCDKQEFSIHRITAAEKRPVDVTGAGDVATAACAIALASGASPIEAAEFANVAAGISVLKLGTATVTLKEVARKSAHQARFITKRIHLTK